MLHGHTKNYPSLLAQFYPLYTSEGSQVQTSKRCGESTEECIVN